MTEVLPPREKARSVTEVPAVGFPALMHPEWRDRYPWLVQGMTTRGSEGQPFDLGLFSGGSSPESVAANWRSLIRAAGCGFVVHAKQVHGSDITTHASPPRDSRAATSSDRDTSGHDASDLDAPDLEVSGPDAFGPPPMLTGPCDGHVTPHPDLLLSVATADCVPVFAVEAGIRHVGVFHAGWRGVVDGVVEAGLGAMVSLGGARPDVHIHLGPAICGDCYEVGPEVFEALEEPVPDRPTPIDLRAVIAARIRRAGVPLDQITVSSHCTRCTGSGLFSHRGGDRGRQVGFIGVRGSSTDAGDF